MGYLLRIHTYYYEYKEADTLEELKDIIETAKEVFCEEFPMSYVLYDNDSNIIDRFNE